MDQLSDETESLGFKAPENEILETSQLPFYSPLGPNILSYFLLRTSFHIRSS